ncbi:hypothetical protein VDG09_15280 [Xanthomonas campestris pv. raphani]|nr:hypothetical protein [Xanthomonas campestris pv. raphani]
MDDAQAIKQPMDMRVERDQWLVENEVHDQAGSLEPYALKLQQVLFGTGKLPVEVFDNLAAHLFQTLGLLVVVRHWLDIARRSSSSIAYSSSKVETFDKWHAG